ncbi:MAG: tRNA lysidine(34) synthetase TilS [Gemmataceae bacterium]|nr:tRNA lysidine(34) synthetase TilS [Gemmataceae bacterium]
MNLSVHVADCMSRLRLEHTTGVVAVSGGPDSVALAYLLIEQVRAGKLDRLILAHVNHQLRGDESDGDEAFVQSLPTLWQLADNPRVVCRTTRIDVASLAKAEHDNLEAVARRERYRWLTEVARQENAAWIATGHTADDQAETVLFRLLRGSGVLGLGGMAECSHHGPRDEALTRSGRATLASAILLVRPLLSVRRQAVLDYVNDNHIPYRVDSSNRDVRFTRNRLRLQLLPQLQSHYNPAVVEVLCRLGEQARELQEETERQALSLLVKTELPRANKMLIFSVERLKICGANEIREMFRSVWKREAWPMGEMDFESWHRLVGIVQGTLTACDFPGKIHARRLGRVIQVVPE